jgi:hypothetical protein
MKFRFSARIGPGDGPDNRFQQTVTAKNRPNAEQVFVIRLYQKCREIGVEFVMPKFVSG